MVFVVPASAYKRYLFDADPFPAMQTGLEIVALERIKPRFGDVDVDEPGMLIV